MLSFENAMDRFVWRHSANKNGKECDEIRDQIHEAILSQDVC